MDLHNLKPETGSKNRKRIGRGGKRGTTSGRGTKGQKSRAGHKIRPAIRDLMMRTPKLRGFKFKSLAIPFTVVNLDILEKNFKAGEKITPKILKAKGLVSFGKGTLPQVKVLDEGRLTKKVILENLAVSRGAADKIISLGGEVRNLQKWFYE